MADEWESTTWSVAGQRRSRPFFGQMRQRKCWKRPVFCFVGGWRPFCGSLEAWDSRRWEIGGERESPAIGERGSGLYYGVSASTIHRCNWSLWSVGSLMKRSCGCDWLDLQVDRTIWMSRVLIWCDAVHRNLSTPGDVGQRDQSLDYFKGWDVFGF